MNYPKTKQIDTFSNHFGTELNDPYRWLEDDLSAETTAWVKAQNDFTFDYFSKIPYRSELKSRIETLWNYEKIGAPFKKGEFTYFYKNNGLQNQAVLYRFKNNEEPSVFLDPNMFSKDGTTSLGSVSFSKDGSLVAYSITEGGSDWQSIKIMDALTKELKNETIVDVKFSGIAWKGNEGFFYYICTIFFC